jgi:Dihydrodipicolinate synthase/N-acetylneuraminate lyase
MNTARILQQEKEAPYPQTLLRPCRAITGISAILLPYNNNNSVDWASFERTLEHTVSAGLIPAVNMDTGYASLIDEATRLEVLQRTSAVTSGLELWLVSSLVIHTGQKFRR